MPTADEVIDKLKLSPHPEGGYFRETFRDPEMTDGRSAGTAIFFLLKAGEVSRWHRVDASEIWHHYDGAPLELGLSADGENQEKLVLGKDISAGQLPQHVIPTGWWQQARSLGEWTLVGCTVSPGFEFSSFEIAPENWEPSSPATK